MYCLWDDYQVQGWIILQFECMCCFCLVMIDCLDFCMDDFSDECCCVDGKSDYQSQEFRYQIEVCFEYKFLL